MEDAVWVEEEWFNKHYPHLEVKVLEVGESCNRPSHERGEEESNKKRRAAEMGGATERREADEEGVEMKGLEPRSFLSKPTCTGNKEPSACMAEMEERSTYVDGPDETQRTNAK